MDNATIAAIATPVSASGGIGVVRISGPEARDIAARFFHRPEKPTGSQSSNTSLAEPSLGNLLPRTLYHGHIKDKEKVVDEVLLVVMPAPRSYTGEDVVEIHAHGGPFVLKTILGLLLSAGARLAQPGEFTRRAFMNGRIDLTRAEAVADIINAGADASLEMALNQATGSLYGEVAAIRETLIEILAGLDVAVDFGDQTDEGTEPEDIAALLEKNILPAIERLIIRHESYWHLKNGVRVVIAGAPNVGKSTLLNVLDGSDRAIVSDVPGTTRDLIEVSIVENGISFVFTDMAGIREFCGDQVEAVGVERALKALGEADIVIFLVDAAAGITDEDKWVYQKVSECDVIMVANKIDLNEADDFAFPPQWTKHVAALSISAIEKTGLDELKEGLVSFANSRGEGSPGGQREKGAIPNLRHKDALVRAAEALKNAGNAVTEGIPLDIAAIDLRHGLQCLGEITGENVGDDVLDVIFERFCIGK